MTMQCKDIPDQPIIEFVWNVNNANRWANNSFQDDGDVVHAMPSEAPWKLRLAKMNQLLKRGLIDGCACGCRGDYVVTAKGCEFIGRAKHVRLYGEQCV